MNINDYINGDAGGVIDLLLNDEIFYVDKAGNKFSRGLAWNHCHDAFQKASRSSGSFDCDALAKELTVYLANWGMYRGSSFLIWLDYRIHIEPVKMMMEKQYLGLFDDGILFSKDDYQKLLFGKDGIYRKLDQYYSPIHQKIRQQQKEEKKELNSESDTLITKILLGVFGCIPAYDTYVKKSLSLFSARQTLKCDGAAVSKKRGNLKSLWELLWDDANNGTELYKEIEKYRENHSAYTFMKLADMYFFKLAELVEDEIKSIVERKQENKEDADHIRKEQESKIKEALLKKYFKERIK